MSETSDDSSLNSVELDPMGKRHVHAILIRVVLYNVMCIRISFVVVSICFVCNVNLNCNVMHAHRNAHRCFDVVEIG